MLGSAKRAPSTVDVHEQTRAREQGLGSINE